MLVCSDDPTHDISGRVRGRDRCPVCLAPLMDDADEPKQTEDTAVVEPVAPKRPGEPKPESKPRDPDPEPNAGLEAEESQGKATTEDDTPEAPVVEPPPVVVEPPPIVLVCEKVPHHDIQDRRSGEMTCPRLGCDGPVVDLVCEIDIDHDLTDLDRDNLACPVCAGQIMKLVCSSQPEHSMFGRQPGQTACPVCDAALERAPLRKWTDETDEILPSPPPPVEPAPSWLRRHLKPLVALLAVLILIPAAAYVFWPVFFPDACRGGLPEVNRIIERKPPAEELRAAGEARLACHRADLAMPLLRGAADSGDGASARELGEIYDPTVDLVDEPERPKPVALYAWHWYDTASKAGDAATDADLKRLRSWAEAQSAKGDPDVAELMERFSQ